MLAGSDSGITRPQRYYEPIRHLVRARAIPHGRSVCMAVSNGHFTLARVSNAVLLSQKYEVIATDIDPDRVNDINKRLSPVVDNEISYDLAKI